VRADGTIGSGAIAGPDAITAFVAELAREARGAPAGARPGDVAPDVQLSTIDGRHVTLHDLIERETLVLFWNPGCGFCQRMLPDLRALEAESPERVHRLLVVSTGSAEENLATGLRSPVVLDDRFAVGRAFGVRGTPSGVVVDADRRIASAVAVGSLDIVTLARSVPVLG
jgi:peroxiredoxin